MSASAVDPASSEVAGTEELTKPCLVRVSSGSSIVCDGDNYLANELSAFGQRGSLIAHVRELTREILESDNTCSVWFQQAEPDVADVFRSLHYDVDAGGTVDIYSIRDKFGALLFRHPWGARSVEYAGSNSFIQINGNGPFFVARARVAREDPSDSTTAVAGLVPTLIGPYTGATTEAQVTILLHELGHITGRLPDDDNSWSGSSSRNTAEVLRHCKKEIHQIAHQPRNGIANVALELHTTSPQDHGKVDIGD
jgi:hypothetical protein